MIGVVLIAAVALAQAPPPDRIATGSASDPKSGRSPRDEYDVRKAKVADSADAHWKLALWCEQNGLKAEAEEQFFAVLRIDPRRDPAWKHLGYRRHRGRWMTADQIADEAEQAKADRHWVPILRKLHDRLHDKKPSHREAARAEILKIRDPRAATALWLALAAGGASEQGLAVTAYDALPGEAAAHAMAILTISGKSVEVRRRAVDGLRKRKPSEYGPPLVGLIRPPLRYEVRPVDGPGSEGILIVEGEKYNVRRVYAPPAAPELEMQPGDVVTLDEFGLPQVSRGGGRFTAIFVDAQGNPVDTAGMDKIKVGQNQVEARRAAADAARQLAEDVAAVEGLNVAIKNSNDRAIAVLEELTKADLGLEPKSWRAWLAQILGKAYAPDRPRPKKVVTDFVCLAYQPTFSVAQPVVSVASGMAIGHGAPS